MKELSKHSKSIVKYTKLENLQIKYRVEYRNVKYPRLEIKPDSLFIILPKYIKNEREFIKRKERWLKEKYSEIKDILKKKKDLLNNFLIYGEIYKIKNNSNLKDIKIDNLRKVIEVNLKQSKKIRKIFKAMLQNTLNSIVKKYAKELNINVNKIFIRHQKTKWASCSLKRNLSFNLKLISLPQNLIEYIVFHELLHMKEKKHNYEFFNKIREKFPDFEKFERVLFEYWFILNNNKMWKIIG